MRYLIVFVSVFLFANTAIAHTDCAQEAARAQQRIENLVGDEAHQHRTELAAILVELCQSRPAGASVVRTPDRKVITTYGLNEGQVVESGSDTTVIVGVDAVRHRDRRHTRGDRRHTRDGEDRAHKRKALEAGTSATNE